MRAIRDHKSPAPAQLVHALVRLALSTDIALIDEVGEAGRQLRVDFLGRARLALHVLVHHRHVVAARVRRHAGQQLVEDHADRVDVRALVDLACRGSARGHVLRRADHVAGLGQLRVALAVRGGDAEVDDLEQALVVDQHVRGLEVAVDDADLVRDGHAGADVDAEAHARASARPACSSTISAPSVCDGKYSMEIA
jgi:hypothetical protein